VAILSASIHRALDDHATLPPALISQVPLDNVTFVGNDQLRAVLLRTTATPEDIEAAMLVNAEARLRALKLMFLLLTGLGMLAFVPAGRLQNCRFDDEPPQSGKT
jgi:hypothetical protein